MRVCVCHINMHNAPCHSTRTPPSLHLHSIAAGMQVRSPLLNLQGNPQAAAIQQERDKQLGGARRRKSDHLQYALLMERWVGGCAVARVCVCVSWRWRCRPSQGKEGYRQPPPVWVRGERGTAFQRLSLSRPNEPLTPLLSALLDSVCLSFRVTALPGGMAARRKFCREVGVALERVQEMQTLMQQVCVCCCVCSCVCACVCVSM